jgi:hypothetical protein
MRIVLDDLTSLGNGVWLSELGGDELQVLGPASAMDGEISIVLLPTQPPEHSTTRVEFEPAAARLLNRGSGLRTVLIFGGSPNGAEEPELTHQTFGNRVQHDDETFLTELDLLPAELAEAGRALFQSIRQEFDGYLQRTPSGRFVNRPSNFWAIKIQPRDRSLSVILRGYAHEYRGLTSLEIKDDQRGYSRFKLARPGDLQPALTLLRKAGRR